MWSTRSKGRGLSETESADVITPRSNPDELTTDRREAHGLSKGQSVTGEAKKD